MTTPPVTRSSGKATTPSTHPPSLLDFKKLLIESEERVIAKVNAKMDTLIEKISAVESAITDIKAVQTQQEMDISKSRT